MTQKVRIPFNRPWMGDRELDYVRDAHARMHLSGDGEYTRRSQRWLENQTGTGRALLTHSCTAALEMAALLLDIQPGDEIIMPAWTFVSTANAFVLRGGIPVFVDVRQDTLNLDPTLIEGALTARTRAIAVVHYGGVAAEMTPILALAAQHNLCVIEDAAQAILASYRGRALGTLGALGTLSFHETKNVISGEGGALLVNRDDWIGPAEIIREKGTDRTRFFRGEVDKYTWQRVGSSFLPGELTAAFLTAQLEMAEALTAQRLEAWQRYHSLLEPLEARGLLLRPRIPPHCQHNAHLYRVLLAPDLDRSALIQRFDAAEIAVTSHYVPLHQSPAGCRYAKLGSCLSNTEEAGRSLLRLPLWVGLTASDQQRVIDVFDAL